MVHVDCLRKISSDLFEQKYLEMINEVEKTIQKELTLQFLKEELGWADKKIHSFLNEREKKQISNDLEDLLDFKHFTEAEEQKV